MRRLIVPNINIGIALVCWIGVSGCVQDTRRAEGVPPPESGDISPADLPGLDNVVAFADGVYSGSEPLGTPAFETLREMGVRTVISVDAAAPDVATATRHGIRYIHLPIGYDRVDDDRALQLARATRDALADGPVYIHCHHGKHRSAGAAGVALIALGELTPDEAEARMRVSGCSPSYTGLYESVSLAEPVAIAVLDAVPADFPSVQRPAGFVKAMVEIDRVAERIRKIERAGWTTPADHPDLVPAAEAGRLADLFRLLVEGDRAAAEPRAFTELLVSSADAAAAIERGLDSGEVSPALLSEQLEIIEHSCVHCHMMTRD